MFKMFHCKNVDELIHLWDIKKAAEYFIVVH